MLLLGTGSNNVSNLVCQAALEGYSGMNSRLDKISGAENLAADDLAP
jgi:hypothetical protein